MEKARIEKIKLIIASALSRPPEVREAFLRDACIGDPELRREVDHYLKSGERTEQFFWEPTTPMAPVTSPDRSQGEANETSGDARIGRTFGKYSIQRRVAEGGMGIVYLALDTHLGREVALKILPEYFSADSERLGRFRREARTTSLLNHPNIVTVFEIGQSEGCEYIVTEFVEGRTLCDLMRQGQIQFVEIIKIASQVAGALAAAHKAGIVHRDIKPENVMLRPDGYVKVLDFGLAKLTDSAHRTPSGNFEFDVSGMKTVPGMILGTVSYMSPEQAEGLETDARTDIWALGALLYELASGRPPFEGPTPSHTIVAILEQHPEPLKDVSPEFYQIISTALQKDKALRFQTAESMATALDELRHRLGYASDKNVSAAVVPQEEVAAVDLKVEHKPARSRKLLWLVPAALLLLVTVAAGIAATAVWISGRLSADADPKPAANFVTPTPMPTVSTTPAATPSVTPTPSATATPSPTPMPVVEPTPEPSTEPSQPMAPGQQKPRPVVAPPVRKIPQPKNNPKPKPKQDPNCVFTNTCG